jgi:hypothetical protein
VVFLTNVYSFGGVNQYRFCILCIIYLEASKTILWSQQHNTEAAKKLQKELIYIFKMSAVKTPEREREKTGHYQGAFHALDHQLLTSAMGQKLDSFK